MARRTPLLPEPAQRDDLRAIVLAPTGKDGRLIVALLDRLAIPCHQAKDIAEVCSEIGIGAGAAIISEEAFMGDGIQELLQVVKNQPSWSDFPLILLTVSGRVTIESERLRQIRRPLGNVFLLERPIRPETLLSTLEIALRGRQRQYQIREQMQQYARAQEALLRSEKLAITGRLAASIAHEINNPLESVTNLLYLMRSSSATTEQQKYLAQAEHELERVAEITKQTLRFYREPSQPTATDVAAVLDSVLKLYAQRIAAAGVTLQREQPALPVTVLSSPGELRQVIANLVGNAIDAMRSGGRLRVRISQHGHRTCCSNVRLTVADSGTGIPSDVLPRIFEPFVTTKGETGTGLGLWVTAEIMKRNGWRIRARSRTSSPSRGTVFSIVIPVRGASQTLAAS